MNTSDIVALVVVFIGLPITVLEHHLYDVIIARATHATFTRTVKRTLTGKWSYTKVDIAVGMAHTHPHGDDECAPYEPCRHNG